MKKTFKPIMIILFCLFLCGCDYLQFPAKTDSSSEITDDETKTEEVKQSESISEAKNISLAAQDNGILITVTKEDDWDISNIWIIDKTNNIEINPNFSQIKWENNKAEILYPFSEKGKKYKFFLGNHDIEQECEILATGGSGYPFKDSFKELRLIPDYNANDNTFSVQFNIEQQSFSDYCTAIFTDNNSEYMNPYIHINCILGDIENSHKAYFGWCNISSNDMLPGPYTITTDQSNIYTYEDYENKYYAELFFSFHRIIGDNRICFQVLDIDCSETKILKDTEFTTTEKFIPASNKNISLKSQENGILITLTKEDDWDVSNLWIINSEDDVEINVGLSHIKWVDNKAQILYPFSEKGKKYTFQLSGNNIYQQCAIQATGGNGYPFNNSFQELKLISSYNSENNTFFVTLNTEPQKFSDFVSCILNDRSLEFTNPYIHINLHLGDRNKKCIWYGCSNIFSEDILPGTFQIGNYTTKTYEYSAYENKFFVEMFLSITKKVGENEIFFQFYNKASSDYKTISNTEFLTTENNNDEIKPVINLVPTES